MTKCPYCHVPRPDYCHGCFIAQENSSIVASLASMTEQPGADPVKDKDRCSCEDSRKVPHAYDDCPLRFPDSVDKHEPSPLPDEPPPIPEY